MINRGKTNSAATWLGVICKKIKTVLEFITIMPEIIPDISSDIAKLQRKVENTTSPLQFRKLLEFTAEACLRREFTLERSTTFLTEDEQREAHIIADLGLAGVRAAVELSSGFNRMSQAGSRQAAMPDLPIKDPERFSDSLDSEAIHYTREFGEALLDEAFECLGEDAAEYAALFAEAKTEMEQAFVVMWLDNRLKEIARHPQAKRYGEERGSSIYHPARLSPKLIGTYPDIETAPTCLGLSMLATSFFHKAGVEVLHAGLMTVRHDAQCDDMLELYSIVPGAARSKYGIDYIPDQLTNSLNRVALEVLGNTLHHDGYHAAVYARLKEGSWMQVDPNFNATVLMPNDEEVEGEAPLSQAFRTLKEMETIAPGLELGIDLDFVTLPRVLSLLLANGDKSLLLPDSEVKHLLLDANGEVSPKQIKSLFLDRFFDMHACQDLVEIYKQIAPDDEILEDLCAGVFDRYVFWEQPAADVLQKCHEDAAYLERRVEDMRLLPIIVLANMAIYYVNCGSDSTTHQQVEVGLPAARVGAAVLSDFMNYFGDISASYRVSQWSSLVPLTETMDRTGSDAYAQFRNDNLERALGMLNYRRTRGIIVTSLETKREE